MRVRSKLLVILAAFALVLTFAPVVAANTQGSCQSGDTSKVRLWENAINDLSDGNDTLWLCNTTSYILPDIAHTVPGDCHSFGFDVGWSDCVSSMTVYLPSSSYRACLYNNTNRTGLILGVQGPVSGLRWNVSPDDAASRLEITYLLAC